MRSVVRDPGSNSSSGRARGRRSPVVAATGSPTDGETVLVGAYLSPVEFKDEQKVFVGQAAVQLAAPLLGPVGVAVDQLAGAL